MVAGELPSDRVQLHVHLLRGHTPLHGRGLVVGGPSGSDPRHDEWRDTWTSQSVPADVSSLSGISCSSEMTCVAVGSRVISTTDGGAHWLDLGSPTGTTALSSVSCISATNCTAVGAANILDTADGATSWTSQAVPGGIGSLVGVSCAGPANCEAVGSDTDFGGTIETLSAPPTVTTNSLTIGTIGVPYVSSLDASGGLAPYSWAVTGGVLPPGLRLAPDGNLSGTPIISGEYPVSFTVTDANLLSGKVDLVISIEPIARSWLLGGRE